jgi:hypothetical protein
MNGGLVGIEVRDSGGGYPEVQRPDAEGSTGRGLLLVRELADGYGVTEHIVGKTVWLIFKAHE